MIRDHISTLTEIATSACGRLAMTSYILIFGKLSDFSSLCGQE